MVLVGVQNKAGERSWAKPWGALELEWLFGVVSSWVRGVEFIYPNTEQSLDTDPFWKGHH